MPDPIAAPTAAASATATLIGAGLSLPVLATVPAVVPELVVFGFALGLRADVLVAGFGGAVAAMAFLNTVPSTGDTLRELVLTTARRLWYALASSMTAGYIAPLLLVLNGTGLRIPEPLMLSVAFLAGAGAQRFLARLVKKGPALLVPDVPKGSGDA